MKFLPQIFLLFLTWFTNLVNATTVFTEGALLNYEFAFSKTENVTEGSVVKIGVQNFARSGIEEKWYSNFSKENVWVGVAFSKEKDKVVQGAGSLAQSHLAKVCNLCLLNLTVYDRIFNSCKENPSLESFSRSIGMFISSYGL